MLWLLFIWLLFRIKRGFPCLRFSIFETGLPLSGLYFWVILFFHIPWRYDFSKVIYLIFTIQCIPLSMSFIDRGYEAKVFGWRNGGEGTICSVIRVICLQSLNKIVSYSIVDQILHHFYPHIFPIKLSNTHGPSAHHSFRLNDIITVNSLRIDNLLIFFLRSINCHCLDQNLPLCIFGPVVKQYFIENIGIFNGDGFCTCPSNRWP